MPEEGGDGASDNGEAGEVPPKGRTRGNREGDVESGTDDTVEDEGDCADQAAKDDGDNSLAPVGKLVVKVTVYEVNVCLPGQADGNDRCRSHPTLGIESIGEPVSEHGPGRPGAALHRRHIAVDVGP